MKYLFPLLIFTLGLVGCAPDAETVTLGPSNYEQFINVDVIVKDAGDRHYVSVATSGKKDNYYFDGFCYLYLRVDFAYFGRGVEKENGQSFFFYSVTLDSSGNGVGKPDGNSSFVCDSIEILRYEPSGRDGVVGTVIIQ